MRLVASLLAVAVAAASTPAKPPPERVIPQTEIAARLDPAAHRIEATASVALAPGSEALFRISSQLLVEEARLDGERVAFDTAPIDGDPLLARLSVPAAKALPGSHRLTFRYSGEIHDPPRVAQFSREQIADQTRGTIQAEGAFLSPDGGWYPGVPGELGTFRLDLSLPAGWEAVAEGTLAIHEPSPSGIRVVYAATRPTEGLHLVAGPWRRIEADHGGIKVAAYVYPEDASLGETYVAALGRYLDLYSAWFGPYPYDRFSVVENFFSTGYGMAGFTVLGRDVMKLPFIVDTSLGHEVAHSWWGNGVFVDEAGGNWCEGLTSYVADHQYKRMQSEAAGAEYRRETCRDYTNYVAEAGRDFPLTQFTERTTADTRAVGYGKTLMVFRMLEARLGKEKFDAALKHFYRDERFKRASWSTLEAVFSKEAGEDLGWFFDQWVDRPGAPSIALDGVRVSPASAGSGSVVEGAVVQAGGPWRLTLPMVFEAAGQAERRTIEIREARTPFRLELPFRPEIVRGDPDQDLFRTLDTAEIPPVLSRLLGDPKTLFVVQDGAGEAMTAAYRAIAETLTRSGIGEIAASPTPDPASVAGRNVFLLGLPPQGALRDLLSEVPSAIELRDEGFRVDGTDHTEPGATVLAVGRRPSDPARAVGLFFGFSPEGVREAGRKLVHYGKYSYLAFVDGKNVAKGVARVDAGPLVIRF